MRDDGNAVLKKPKLLLKKKKTKFLLFFLFLLVREYNLILHFNLVPADIMNNRDIHPLPSGK